MSLDRTVNTYVVMRDLSTNDIEQVDGGILFVAVPSWVAAAIGGEISLFGAYAYYSP